jgi:ABC-type amino acid transport substrate-binding protein
MMRRLILMVACFALAPTAGAQNDAADTLSRARARGSLEIAVYDGFPPYSFRNEHGAPAGVDVDLANALAAKLGLRARLRFIVAGEEVGDDLRNNVWKGHYLGGGVADVMLHVPTDPAFADGQPQALIFGSYFRESITIASLATRKLRLDAPLALAGHRVGVELATLSDHYMSSAYAGRLRTAAVRKASLQEAVNALGVDEVDAVMGPKGELQGLLAKAGLHDIRYRDPPLSGMLNGAWDIGLAVGRADGAALRVALIQALQELRADGTLAGMFAAQRMQYMDGQQGIAAAGHVAE